MSTLAAWRDRLSYQPLSLGIVAMATCVTLVIANQLTRPKVIEAEKHDLQMTLTEVLPAGFADNDMLADNIKVTDDSGHAVTIYRARKAGTMQGAVFQTSARGYAGDILVLIGIDTDGRLLGARVIKHLETPGLGDKIEASKSKWIKDFEGKSLESPPADKWAVKKDGGVFDQFAGATITPRAVVKAVKQGLTFFAAHRTEILAPNAREATEGKAP